MWLRGAALGVLAAAIAGGAAQAGVAYKKPAHRHASAEPSVHSEIEALKASLAAEHAARTDMQAHMQAEIDQANATARAATDQLESNEAAQADATAAVIQSIPTAVAAEADKLKPKTDWLYFKGVKITPAASLSWRRSTASTTPPTTSPRG